MLAVLLINVSVAIKQHQLYGRITLSMFLYQVFMGWYIVDYFIFERYVLSIYDVVEEHFGLMLIVSLESFM
jgi:hypothetical protein